MERSGVVGKRSREAPSSKHIADVRPGFSRFRVNSYPDMKLAIALLSLYLTAQAQMTGADAAALATQTTKVTRDWDKMTSSGISVSLHETGRSTENGALVVRYALIAKGAPRDKTFTLVQWPITAQQPSAAMEGVTFGADGTAMCDGRSEDHCGDPAKKDDPIDFAFQPSKGEIYRMVLVSDDKETKIAFSVVPDPISSKDGQCSLEIVRLLPHFELVMLRMHGLQPSEKFQIHSQSYDEKHDSEPLADTNGDYASALMPFVKGKSNGETSIKVNASHCAPQIRFPWGTK